MERVDLTAESGVSGEPQKKRAVGAAIDSRAMGLPSASSLARGSSPQPERVDDRCRDGECRCQAAPGKRQRCLRRPGGISGGCGLALALLALGSCSGRSTAPPERPAPVWISLARGARPAPLEGLIAAWAETAPLLAVRAAPDEAGVWIDHPIEAAAWERSESDAESEEWSAARPANSG